MEKRSRNASMELLRVLAMLMIIGHHLVYYSALTSYDPCVGRYFAQMVNVGGRIGVNLFVMIGAWYMSGRKYRMVRTARIWLQTFTTGLLALLAAVLIGGKGSVPDFGSALRGALLPVSQGGYWFAGAYIMLTLMTPFLNRLLDSVKRQGLDVLLGVMTFMMAVLPTVFIGKTTYFSPIFWFVYLYLLIGRLRRWPVKRLARWGKWMFLAGVLFVFGASLSFEKLGASSEFYRANINYFSNRQETLPVLMASIGLFLAFVRKKPFVSRPIEWLGKVCFGVYLIHDNALLRRHIWSGLVKAGSLAHSVWFIPYAVCAVCLVFIGCAAVETIRLQTVGRLEGMLLDRLRGPMARFDRMIEESTGAVGSMEEERKDDQQP